LLMKQAKHGQHNEQNPSNKPPLDLLDHGCADYRGGELC
jgi:hypothetical protein